MTRRLTTVAILILVAPVSARAQSGLPGSGDGAFHHRFLAWSAPTEDPADKAATPVDAGSAALSLPQRISSGFGARVDPFRGVGGWHVGIDLPAPRGTPVFASDDGVVTRAGWVGGYGNMIEVRHADGLITRYGHLSSILTAPLAHVHRGTEIGLVGSTGRSTGNHLHYEVRRRGTVVDPLPLLLGPAPVSSESVSAKGDAATVSGYAATRAAAGADLGGTGLGGLAPTAAAPPARAF